MPMRRTHGFTLVEVLVALVVMSILAVMSWQALEAMQQVQTHTRTRSDQVLTVQASLGQWGADLDALLETEVVPALSFDGRTLRLTRRDSLEAQHPGLGLQVVAWALHQGRWTRWVVGDIRHRTALLQAWDEAARWGQTPIEADVPRQTALMPVKSWQLFYYRSDAWTNPLSADVGETSNPDPNAGGQGAKPSVMRLPDGVRLVLELGSEAEQGQAFHGTLVKDWARPVLGGGKS